MRFAGVVAVSIALMLPAVSQAQDTHRKARIFVTESQSWETGGSVGGTSEGFGGHAQGGARPQTAEIIKTFGERCPDVTVNNRRDMADYVVLLDHEGGKSLGRDNKVVVFNPNGDSILSNSTRSLGNAVKDACAAITRDWPARRAKLAEAAVNDPVGSETSSVKKISVTSTPPGADIELDGNFVGSTPSVIETTAGEHSVAVKKSGYKSWERKMNVTGGTVTIAAALEKAE
jgi:PEGA domain